MGGNRRGRSAGLPIGNNVAPAPSPAAPPPPPAAPPDPTPTASLSTAGRPGASVSTSTGDSWSEVTAGSPHSRRANHNINIIATDNNNIIATDNNIIATDNNNPIATDNNNNSITDVTPPTPPPPSTTTRGAVDFSLHPDFDLSDDAEGGAPTNYNNDDVSPSPSGGDVVKPSSIIALFAELDLLHTQATNIQSQLDGQRAVSADFARSISNMQRKIVTLRDASTSHSDMIRHAIKIADESHGRILEFKSVASDLTYQFHTVSTTVDNFIAQQTTSTSTSPPVQSPTIEEAFAAADAVLRDGIASIENEVGDRLDRRLSSQTNNTSTPGVRFTDVND